MSGDSRVNILIKSVALSDLSSDVWLLTAPSRPGTLACSGQSPSRSPSQPVWLMKSRTIPGFMRPTWLLISEILDEVE